MFKRVQKMWQKRTLRLEQSNHFVVCQNNNKHPKGFFLSHITQQHSHDKVHPLTITERGVPATVRFQNIAQSNRVIIHQQYLPELLVRKRAQNVLRIRASNR